MKGDHRFAVSGFKKKILWRYTRLVGKAIGWCYHQEGKILISHRLSGRRRLDTEIHEYLHLVLPQLSEEAVSEHATDLAKILWALGYRIKNDSDY